MNYDINITCKYAYLFIYEYRTVHKIRIIILEWPKRCVDNYCSDAYGFVYRLNKIICYNYIFNL